MSRRNITVSTCGLVPEIRKLAEENLQITLALSLHGVTDEKRRELMPVAEKYSIAELMDACGYYLKRQGGASPLSMLLRAASMIRMRMQRG